MANKNIRDIVVKVSGKDIATAATNSEKLNNNLSKVIETVKGTGRNFKSINTALDKLSSSMKTINSSMSASKIKTKGLETYQRRMEEVNKTLTMVNSTAEKTAANLADINKSTSGTRAASEVSELADGFKQLEKRINIAIVQLREIVENTGKTANRMKQTREVTREAGETFKEYSERVDKAKKSQDNFNNAARGLTGQGRNQKRAFGELAFSMNPLTSLYASIAINVYALSEGFRLLNEAANFDRLMSQTASFSAAVSGINVKGLAVEMSELSAGVLSVRESMQFATKGAAFNFTADQLERLTVGARKASIALGRDFNDSMDRVLRGISKQEIELFDELGVVTRLTPAFEAYAGSVGKSVEQLSDYERQLALTIEVEKQLSERFSGIEVTATAWEELGVTVKNVTDNVLIGLSKALEPLAIMTKNMLELVSSSTDLSRSTTNLVEAQDTFNKALDGGHLGQAIVAYSEMVEAQDTITETVGSSAEMLEKARETTESLTLSLQVLTAVTSVYAARTLTAMLTPAVVAARTAFISGIAANKAYTASLILMTGGKIPAGILAIATGLRAVTMAVKASTIAMITNPLFLILTGAALAGFFLFKDQLAGVADAIMEMIPGIDSSSQALEKQKKAVNSAEVGIQRYARALGDAGVAVSSLSQDEIAQLGSAFLANERDSAQAVADIQALATQSSKGVGPMREFADQIGKLRESSLTKGLEKIPEVLEESRKKFKEVSESLGLIDNNIDTFDKLYNFTEALNSSIRDLSFNLAVAGNNNTLFAGTKVDILQSELAMQEHILSKQLKMTEVSQEDVRLRENEIYLIKQRLAIAKDQAKMDVTNFQNAEATFRFEMDTVGVYTEKSAQLAAQLDNERNILATKSVSTTVSTVDLELQRNKVALLGKELRQQEDLEKAQKATRQADVTNFINQSDVQNSKTFETLGNRRVSEIENAARVSIAAESAYALALAKYEEAKVEGKTSPEGMASLAQEVSNASMEVGIAKAKEQAAAYRDMASAIGEVAGSVPGLTGIQEQFIGMSATIADTIANTTELIASGQELTLSDFSDSIIAVGSMASSMFSELSKGVVADIDNQIAAEKRRDGKSQESLAKIQALEKKKIKEQEKSKIAQTAMSTSLAIMKTMAEVPFPGNLAMSAAIGAMGVMQINNIKKASAGQMAALQTDTGGLSLSVGSRNNAVDVGQGASRGELSFLRGEAGTGTGANNFTPGRSGGGSVVVGERGPETITPTQPINVTPASETSKEEKPSVNQTLNLSIQAIDSQSIEDRSDDIWMALERAANERGYTLNSLS